MVRSRILIAGLHFLIACIATQSFAAVYYECRNADGNTVYRKLPCEKGDSRRLNIGRQATDKKKICSAAREFSVDVAEDMREGRDARSAFDALGGVNAVSKAALNIVNYVYSFDANPEVPVIRIGSLVQARCRNGAFGSFVYSDLPREYDPQYEPEGEETEVPSDRDFIDGSESSEEERSLDSGFDRTPVDGRRDSGMSDREESGACDRYRRKIETLDKQMRQGYGSDEGDDLRRKRREYRSRIRENC